MISVHRPGVALAAALLAMMSVAIFAAARGEARRRDERYASLVALRERQVRALEVRITELEAQRAREIVWQRAEIQQARRQVRERIIAERIEAGVTHESHRCNLQVLRCDPRDPLCGVE